MFVILEKLRGFSEKVPSARDLFVILKKFRGVFVKRPGFRDLSVITEKSRGLCAKVHWSTAWSKGLVNDDVIRPDDDVISASGPGWVLLVGPTCQVWAPCVRCGPHGSGVGPTCQCGMPRQR